MWGNHSESNGVGHWAHAQERRFAPLPSTRGSVYGRLSGLSQQSVPWRPARVAAGGALRYYSNNPLKLPGMTDLAFLVQQTQGMRRDLLSFLKPLPADVLMTSLPEYGQGSILSTLTHVADCYGGWVGKTLLEEAWDSADTPGDLPSLSARFARVDALLERALACPRMQSGEVFETVDFEGNRRRLAARWVVMHPITHEFHHKGQVVTLLRKLGHPVTVDLDLPPPGGW